MDAERCVRRARVEQGEQEHGQRQAVGARPWQRREQRQRNCLQQWHQRVDKNLKKLLFAKTQVEGKIA